MSILVTTPALDVPVNRGEFWTAKQRDAHSLHEVSYRACFKPQLPRWFIERYTQPGDAVYDPFSGRGTTALEAALLGRRVIANDVNPLSRVLAEPRLSPPLAGAVEARLAQIAQDESARAGLDLSMFYHPATLAEIVSLRQYLVARRSSGAEDGTDRWIRMVATNRLTGHSPGFFSVYSFPPNQAVSADSQRRINQRRAQQPEYRDTHRLILRKSGALLKDLSAGEMAQLRKAARTALFLEGDARSTPQVADTSVQLTVTSPPFLDVVQYADDNWLRGWFNALPVDDIAARITMSRRIEDWSAVMAAVFSELYRITRAGGIVAFEVGEVRNGKVKLEEHVVPLGRAAGFTLQEVMIHEQQFTKTANIWGVANNLRGTNSNRIVVFRKT
jgi:DNA modification methylase